MAWSTLYLEILKASADNWVNVKSKKTERQQFLAEVKTFIQDEQHEKYPEENLPDNLEKKIRTWYENNVKSKQTTNDPDAKKGVRSYVKVYTTKQACTELFKARIHDAIKEKTDEPVGGKDWLQYHPAALSSVFNALDDDELEECRELADKWNAEGPSLEKKQQTVNRYLNGTISKFVKDLERTMGVQVFIMAGHVKSNGNIVRQKFESRPAKGLQSFTESHKQWKNDTWNSFEKYLNSQFGGDEDTNDDDEEQPPKKVDLVEVNEDNEPILPEITRLPLSERKQIVREYVKLCYRHYTSNPKVIVPWSSITLDNTKYIDTASIPENVLLREPSKLKSHDISVLWRHWRTRQSKGYIGLQFIKANPGDKMDVTRKGKGKEKQPVWVDLNDLDDSREVGRDDQEEENNAQPVRESHEPSSNPGDNNQNIPHDDSPAAHAATKHQRLAFLETLSQQKDYQQMVKSILRVRGSDISANDDYPPWANWLYNQPYLPEEFHSRGGFKAFEKAIKVPVDDNYSAQELYALLVGLVLRDLNGIITAENNLPSHLQESPLGKKHLKLVINACSPTLVPVAGPSKKRKVPPRSASQAQPSPSKKAKTNKRY